MYVPETVTVEPYFAASIVATIGLFALVIVALNTSSATVNDTYAYFFNMSVLSLCWLRLSVFTPSYDGIKL